MCSKKREMALKNIFWSVGVERAWFFKKRAPDVQVADLTFRGKWPAGSRHEQSRPSQCLHSHRGASIHTEEPPFTPRGLRSHHAGEQRKANQTERQRNLAGRSTLMFLWHLTVRVWSLPKGNSYDYPTITFVSVFQGKGALMSNCEGNGQCCRKFKQWRRA